jgi:capsule polysaccharide export protein KpsC/LpsZ
MPASAFNIKKIEKNYCTASTTGFVVLSMNAQIVVFQMDSFLMP